MSAMRREEEQVRDTGLTTADLANPDEAPSKKRDLTRDDRELDRPPADPESRQIEFRSADPVESVTTARTGNVAPDRDDGSGHETPLFSAGEAADFHSRWDAVQVSFVDEPRVAVQQADGLVAGAMKRLAEIFADERARLDEQWDRGGDVSTEDLRIALQRYRSFFGRLLSV